MERLPFAEVAYNNSLHSSTGSTPFKIATGVDFMLIPELLRESPSSLFLADWMDDLKTIQREVQKALDKARDRIRGKLTGRGLLKRFIGLGIRCICLLNISS